MANAYSKLYVQIVFTPRGRLQISNSDLRILVEKYIYGILANLSCHVLALKCMPDHIHILTSIHPDRSVSEIVRTIKANSSKHLNEIKAFPGMFHWQQGYGAFSYSQSSIPNVVHYINNQEEHHQRMSFEDEYKSFLNSFQIDYNPAYLFDRATD
ncbi:MAG: IS200/IS605 family transposase [Candidatus Cloacimonetes bacterium]|nr:IS200/IS605 family transposase [Candidatus Cloacimonadota bacterium]